MSNRHYTLSSLSEIRFKQKADLPEWIKLAETFISALNSSDQETFKCFCQKSYIEQYEEGLYSNQKLIYPFNHNTVQSQNEWSRLSETENIEEKLHILSTLKKQYYTSALKSTSKPFVQWVIFESKTETALRELYRNSAQTNQAGDIFENVTSQHFNSLQSELKNKFNNSSVFDFEKFIIEQKWTVAESIFSSFHFTLESALHYCIKYLLNTRYLLISESNGSHKIDHFSRMILTEL